VQGAPGNRRSYCETTIDNSEPFTGGDANATTVYNGKYKFDAIFSGVGVNFYF